MHGTCMYVHCNLTQKSVSPKTQYYFVETTYSKLCDSRYGKKKLSVPELVSITANFMQHMDGIVPFVHLQHFC